MKIALFGLGYVGAVSAACLANLGHEVEGVDVNAEKVRLVNDGVSPIAETGLGQLIRESVASGRLRASTDVDGAVACSDCSLVCVGTPSLPNGCLDTTYVERAVAAIGDALKRTAE